MMRLIMICLVLSTRLSFLFSIYVVKMKDHKAFVFTKLMVPSPEETKNYPVRIQNKSIFDNNERLNYDMHISNKWNTVSAVISIERCATQESLDSCISLTPVKTGNLCPYLNKTDDTWSPLLTCLQPTLTCPLTGFYHGRNCTINMDAFRFFPLMKFYWKSKACIYSKKTLLTCTISEGKLMYNYH